MKTFEVWQKVRTIWVAWIPFEWIVVEKNAQKYSHNPRIRVPYIVQGQSPMSYKTIKYERAWYQLFEKIEDVFWYEWYWVFRLEEHIAKLRNQLESKWINVDVMKVWPWIDRILSRSWLDSFKQLFKLSDREIMKIKWCWKAKLKIIREAQKVFNTKSWPEIQYSSKPTDKDHLSILCISCWMISTVHKSKFNRLWTDRPQTIDVKLLDHRSSCMHYSQNEKW